VALGEEGKRKGKGKKTKVGERSVSQTRDGTKEKRKNARKERKEQKGNRRGRLLHPPPLKTELSPLSGRREKKGEQQKRRK